MGNTKSTCKVVSEARYEIFVEVFSPKDIGGEFAQKKYTVLPGNRQSIPVTKKGVQLRISGNGRIQDLMRAGPGEVIIIRKVQRGQLNSQAEDAEEASKPETLSEGEQQAAEPKKIRKTARASKDQQSEEWLDEKGKYSKDELEQLVVKLKKEGRTEQRAKILKQIQKKEAELQREESKDDGDALSASIAALQRRNDKLGFSRAQLEERQSSGVSDNSIPERASSFTADTNAQTDELFAAINRLTVSNAPHHAKKNSWERAPRYVAHV